MASEYARTEWEGILYRLVRQVRHRVALGVSARAATAALVVAAVHATTGGGFSAAGILLLAGIPVLGYVVAWRSVLGGSTPALAQRRLAQRRLAQALDQQLAGEDRLPSALDPGIAGQSGAAAQLVREQAGMLQDRLREAANVLAPIPWASLRWLPVGALLLAVGLWIAPEPTIAPPADTGRGDNLPEDVLRDLADMIDAARTDEPADVERPDPLADLARKVAEADVTPSEALAAAAEAMESLERSRAEMQQEGADMEALAQAMMQMEDMRDLAQALLDHRFEDARSRIREFREEIEQERKEVLASKEKGNEKERKRRLEDLQQRERRLDELEKSMREYGERLRKLNRKMDTTKEMSERVRYAQRQADRKKYRDWLEQLGEGQGKGGRGGPRRLGNGRDGGQGQGGEGGGDEWGTGSASHAGPPQRTSIRKIIEKVAAEEGDGGVTRFFVASDDDGSESKIDFRKLVAEFEGRALDTVYSEEVPVSFRRYVTDYFDRVKPPEKQ